MLNLHDCALGLCSDAARLLRPTVRSSFSRFSLGYAEQS